MLGGVRISYHLRLILASLLLSMPFLPYWKAWSQNAGCSIILEKDVQAYAAARKGSSNCGVKCLGCGCKGGPGYRVLQGSRKGGCVSYSNLVRDCGPAPHGKCRSECVPVVVGCRKPTDAEVKKAKKQVRKQKLKLPCKSGLRDLNFKCVSINQVRKICGLLPSDRCHIVPKRKAVKHAR